MFNKYPAYKDNGIINIPSHWNEIAFNWLFKKKEISNLPNENLLSVYLDRGVIPYSEGGGLVHKPAESLEKYQLVEQDDFVMNNQQAWRGSVGISKYRGIVSPAYLIYTPDRERLLPRFLNYLLRDKYIVNEFMNASLSVGTIQRQIKSHLLKKIKIPFPSLGEQAQIANFLEQETQKIDNLIARQEKLIELLEEQRKSIISYAVTKGVNPNAKMKVSGVEWLGEVPEHWDQKPFHSLYKRVKITNRPKERLLSVYREYGVIPKDSRDDNHNVASEDLSPYQFVDKNYLVVNKMKAWQGSLAISEYKGIVSPAYFIYQPKYNYHHQYFHYLMRSIFYIQTYKNISKGIRVGQWDLDDYQFNRIKILLPPNKEQIEIVNYIKEENAKINILIQKQTTLIEKLKEYRASIICHAVTGQIDVRDLAK